MPRPRFHLHYLDFDTRALFVITTLEMRYEERDGFISDDDVLDACQAWTLTPYCNEEDADDSDYRNLCEEIFDCLSD